jgi:hypothetical protein
MSFPMQNTDTSSVVGDVDGVGAVGDVTAILLLHDFSWSLECRVTKGYIRWQKTWKPTAVSTLPVIDEVSPMVVHDEIGPQGRQAQ